MSYEVWEVEISSKNLLLEQPKVMFSICYSQNTLYVFLFIYSSSLQHLRRLSNTQCSWSKVCSIGILILDCKTVSSFAGRLKIQWKTGKRKWTRGREQKGMGSLAPLLFVSVCTSISHLTNVLGFLIFRRRKRLFCSLFWLFLSVYNSMAHFCKTHLLFVYPRSDLYRCKVKKAGNFQKARQMT